MKNLNFLLVILLSVFSLLSSWAQPGLYEIEAGAFYYSPEQLIIESGSTVTWVNVGGFHDVNGIANSITKLSFNNPEDFSLSAVYSAGTVSPVEIGSFTFTEEGTYAYDCSVGNHAAQGMVGTIIVTPQSGSFGCVDENACNYDSSATEDDGSCWYAEEYYDCDGVCLADVDGDGVCDELDNCTDLYACNYGLDFYPNEVPCEYIGDSCAIYDEMVDDFINPGYYSWDENCECSPPPGCEDETACNYGMMYVGAYYIEDDGLSTFSEIIVWGTYEEPPFCLNPGDSCNVFADIAVVPSPIGYSGVLNSECECVCTNPENIQFTYFDITQDEFVTLTFNNCDELSIDEESINKTLITKVDILGRETNNNKGFQLHIYDDGSVEKKYVIK